METQQEFAPYRDSDHKLAKEATVHIAKIHYHMNKLTSLIDNHISHYHNNEEMNMSDENKVGIEETKEVVKAIEIIAVLGTKTLANGLQLSDFSALGELAKSFSDFKAAIQGISLVDDELKDLDQAELLELGSLVFDMVKKVKAEL